MEVRIAVTQEFLDDLGFPDLTPKDVTQPDVWVKVRDCANALPAWARRKIFLRHAN